MSLISIVVLIVAPYSLIPIRTIVTNDKFKVKKFDGTNNFGMWQCGVLDVLCQQELDHALDDKHEDMDKKDWESSIVRHIILFDCVSPKIKIFFHEEDINKEVMEDIGG